jgi:hypothetical protein
MKPATSNGMTMGLAAFKPAMITTSEAKLMRTPVVAGRFWESI